MKLQFIIISMFMFMMSCKKERTERTIAEGYIFHSGTKKPLDSVKVYLYDGIGHSGGWVDLGGDSKGSNRIDSVLTDKSGFFHIELDAEEPVLYPFKTGYSFEYIMGGAVIGIVPLNIGANKNLKFELDAWAYFRPKSYIIANYSENDTSYFSDYAKVFINFNIGKGPHILSYDDQTWDKGRLTKGDHFFHYWLKYKLSNEWVIREDSVYIPSFTTYKDTIYY